MSNLNSPPLSSLTPIANWNNFPLPLTGWLKDYIDLCRRFDDAELETHYFAGLITIASLTDRRIYITYGGRKIYPNLWCLFIGDSGAGKSWPIDNVRNMMEEIKYFTFPSRLTMEGIVKISKEKESTIAAILSDEFTALLEHTKGSGVKALLSDMSTLYDCNTFPVALSAAKGYQVINKPFINLLGATTPTGLGSLITIDNIETGFFSRFIYIPVASKRFKELPTLPDIDSYLTRHILSLEEILKELPDRIEIKNNVYKEFIAKQTLLEEKKDITNNTFIGGIGSRFIPHFRKFVLLLTISEGKGVVTKDTIDMAFQLTLWTIEAINSVMIQVLAFTDTQKWAKRVLKVLKSSLQKEWDNWFNKSTIQKWCKIDKKQLELALIELQTLDLIISDTQPRGTQKVEVYKIRAG